MNTLALVDMARLEAISAPISFFMEENGEFECGVIEDWAFKFVVLLDRTLVIGPVRDHKALYGAYETRELGPEQAKCRLIELRDIHFSRFDCPIIAAGMVSVDGRVTEWKSDGFQVETPNAMRAEIEQEIRGLYASGTLRVK